MTDFEFKQTAVAQYTEEELNEMSKTLVESINMIRYLKTILNPKMTEQAEPVLREATTLMHKITEDMRTLRQMSQ